MTEGIMDPRPGASRSHASERACDFLVVAFALWTVCCHLTVLSGGTRTRLVALFAVAACAVIAVAFGRRRPRQAAADAWYPADRGTPLRSRWAIRGSGIALAVAGLIVFRCTGNVILLWWWIVGLLCLAAWTMKVWETPQVEAIDTAPWQECLLWAVAAGCAVLALVCHRYDSDDGFYVGLAVAFADNPSWVIMRGDPVHGLGSLPLHLPIYRVHSYELLNGLISWVTSIPAIYCFHWVSATLAAMLVPLAYSRLYKILAPRIWLWALAATLFVLVTAGETHRWYGNFCFVRIWQGKSIFLSAGVPLICAYALQYSMRQSTRHWLLLMAAQIAAAGCTSSAIWAAPAVASIALLCGTTISAKGARMAFAGLLASGYVAVAGLMLIGEARGVLGLPIAVIKKASSRDLRSALTEVLGDSRLLTVMLFVIMAAWAFCPRGVSRRFAVVFPLAGGLLLLNPYCTQFVKAWITGYGYWRSFWAIPLPALITLVLISPLWINRSAGGVLGAGIGINPSMPARMAGTALFLAGLAVFALWVPRYSTLSKRNDLTLKWPALKVLPEEYELARSLNGTAGQGAVVVAPDEVGIWIPTFHRHAYPISVKDYLLMSAYYVGVDEARRRMRMTRYAGGQRESVGDAAVFQEGLSRYGVGAVCLRVSVYADEARTILREAGFYRTMSGERYEIWSRC